MKWTKLIVMLCIFAVVMLALVAGTTSEGSNSTDNLEVSTDIVGGVSAAPAAIEEEAELVYYDEVGTLVMICFTVSADAQSERNVNLFHDRSDESRGTTNNRTDSIVAKHTFRLLPDPSLGTDLRNPEHLD